MDSRVTLGTRIPQDENLNIKTKKSTAGLGGQSRSLKTAPKKAGVGLVSRRALNDITNKSSSVSQDVHPKRKDSVKEEFHVADHKEFSIAEEGFLHDHSKCIKAQKAALDAFQLDLVLPGYGSKCKSDSSNSEQAKGEVSAGSPRCYPEMMELPMCKFFDWINCSMRQDSPPCSPIHSASPLPWQFDEEVEFVLKQENDAFALTERLSQ